MTRTRVVAISSFVSAVAGLVLVVSGLGAAATALGAAFFVGGGMAFARHLWRESNRKRARALQVAISAVDGVHSKVVAQMEDLSSMNREGLQLLERLHGALADMPSEQDILKLQSMLENEVVTQVSGVLGVYASLRPSLPWIPFGRGAIAGDCALRLTRLLLASRSRSVIEAGSGLSTVLIARALELSGSDGVVISLEHDERWADATRTMISEHGLDRHALVIHAPLVPTRVGTEEFLWYDLSGLTLPEEIDLIFVDGPPGTIGPMARYPAVPLLFDRLKPGGVIMLDDANRAEERAIVQRWLEQFDDLVGRFHRDLKGTAELSKL